MELQRTFNLDAPGNYDSDVVNSIQGIYAPPALLKPAGDIPQSLIDQIPILHAIWPPAWIDDPSLIGPPAEYGLFDNKIEVQPANPSYLPLVVILGGLAAYYAHRKGVF